MAKLQLCLQLTSVVISTRVNCQIAHVCLGEKHPLEVNLWQIGGTDLTYPIQCLIKRRLGETSNDQKIDMK